MSDDVVGTGTGSPDSDPSLATPPGWHADPFGRFDHRYWDGAAWTSSVSRQGLTGVDAPEPSGPGQGDPTVAVGATLDDALQRHERRQQSRQRSIAIAVVLVVMIVGGLFLAWRSHKNDVATNTDHAQKWAQCMTSDPPRPYGQSIEEYCTDKYP